MASSATPKQSQSSTPASFQVAPATVNFGKVTVGKSISQSVAVTNTGSSALNITQTTFSNAQFTATGMAMPMTVASGQAGNFSVSVNPTSAGNLTGTLTVQGDGGSSPVIVNLSATAVAPQPQITLSSSAVDFGSVGVSSQGNASVIVTNAGGADLTISVITLNGTGFSVSGIATPKTLSSGQSATLAVAFRPTVSGSVNGSVSITSNDPATPTANISLTGSGSTAPIGQLSAAPSVVSLGNVGTGASATQQIILSNTGNAAVHISAVSITGAGFTVTGLTAPATVNVSQTATATVHFAPSAAGSVAGTLTITSDANQSPLKIALSASGVQSGLSVSPASFNFGSIVDGQSKSQTFTVTNTGASTLTIAQLSVAGSGYSVSGLATPANVAAGQTTSFSATFAPASAGTLNGSMSLVSNAPNSPATVSLSGTGVAATVSMSASPASVSFGSINAGSSNSQSVTLTNVGNTSVTISQISMNAKDVASSGIVTPLTLAAGQKASMTLTFKPTSSETVSGSVSVVNSQGSSTVIPISASGVQPTISVTPSSVSFGSISVGSSNSQTMKVTNSGTGVLTVSQINVAGSGFSSNGVSLPISLNAGQSGNFNLQFAPSSAGAVTGSASLVSNAPGSPAVISLSGTGTAASRTLSFSTSSVSFGNVNDGSSASQSVTVTNVGNSNVTISQISSSGTGFALSGAGTPLTLSSTQTFTFGVLFNPISAGSVTGSVIVASNASGSPKTIALSGTGVATTAHTVALTWNASTSSVSGYNVYRSTTSGSGYILVNGGLVGGLAFTDTSVRSGTTYYYVTTAVDSSGDESSYSNEAQAIVP
ncbi:MAG: choice-of-anchor D domain-containing protein [Candidatus Acidiferrum sp.]